jgi:hypothetical protein
MADEKTDVTNAVTTTAPTAGESTTTTTNGTLIPQTEVDRIVGKARQEAREREQRRIADQYGDLDALAQARKELEEKRQAEMSEAERLQAKIIELEKTAQANASAAQAAELKALRLEVGTSKGLPSTLATVLQGEDRAALEAFADSLLQEIAGMGTGKPIPPGLDATKGGADKIKPGHGLTQAQRNAADKAGITYEEMARQKAILDGKQET